MKVVQHFHKAGGTESKLVGVQYLGQQLHARLDWSSSDDTMCRKGQSRHYFLRWLGSFNICYKLLRWSGIYLRKR